MSRRTFTLYHLIGAFFLMAGIVFFLFFYFLNPFQKHAEARALHLSNPELTAALEDRTLRENGAVLYKLHCATCHGFQAQGMGRAPSLCGVFAKYDKNLNHVIEQVSNGNEMRGMPSWKKMIKPRDIVAVSSYLSTL